MSIEEQPDSPSGPEIRSFTADEPKHTDWDEAARWEVSNETQQEEKAHAVSPLQHCTGLLSFLLTESCHS